MHKQNLKINIKTNSKQKFFGINQFISLKKLSIRLNTGLFNSVEVSLPIIGLCASVSYCSNSETIFFFEIVYTFLFIENWTKKD